MSTTIPLMNFNGWIKKIRKEENMKGWIEIAYGYHVPTMGLGWGERVGGRVAA